MSAFVVEKKTIDRIVTWVDRDLYRWHPHLYDKFVEEVEAPKAPQVKTKKFDVPHDSELPRILGAALWRMNVEAVNQRYNENEEVPEYTFMPEPASRVRVLKSLQCLRYQCTEGTVPTWPLYSLLTQCILFLAGTIVESLPEYKEAEWC